MVQTFKTLYDIQALGGVPPYSSDDIDAWIFSFTAVSIFLLILHLITWKRNRSRLLAIPILGAAIIGYLTLDHWDRRATAAALKNGSMRSIEGCIANFRTNAGDFYPRKSSQQDEEWDIRDEHFSYKVTSNAPGYHVREARGGVVHSGQYLRVGFVITPVFRRKEIMRIEVGPVKCG